MFLQRPPMRATGFTHVSIHAYDLQESLRFYVDVLGMRRVPSPDFEHPVEWLELGDQHPVRLEVVVLREQGPAVAIEMVLERTGLHSPRWRRPPAWEPTSHRRPDSA